MPMSYRLFIPGPVEVAPKTYTALATPVFGHRSPEFVDLYQSLQPGLKQLFNTQDPVFISTSSAWGVMEGCIRNLVDKRVLNCMCGAFSDKWYEVSKRCGKEAEPLRFEWGHPVEPEALRKALASGRYDAFTLVHNETSTGVQNPLEELMAVAREFPEILSVVDAVSSLSAVSIEKDALGIDVLLTGSQKALALPPGMALFSVSQRAFARTAAVHGRGYYFDFLEFLKNHEKGMTPSTPVLPLLFGLRSILEDICAEGLENRYARHARLNAKVHAWAAQRGFSLFPDPAYASKTLTCLRNSREVDLAALNRALKARFHCTIDIGYGKLKFRTFRISNMGIDEDSVLDELLGHLDVLLGESP